MRILITANAYYTISGGDVIFVEFAKKWITKHNHVDIVTNKKGKKFCKDYGFNTKNVFVFEDSFLDKFGIYIGNLLRVIVSFFQGFILNPKEYDRVFSASEFLPDILPALLMKLFYRRIKWIAAFYVFAPDPFAKDYQGDRLRGFIYLISQKLSLFLINHWADYVFTASKGDLEYFTSNKRFGKKRVLAVRGGLDIDFISSISVQHQIYDAIYMGRLHPQKNVIELIHVWKSVVDKLPKMQLALIGSGSLEVPLKQLVKDLNLERNITFLGTRIGKDKLELLSSSRIFVSTSHFDSGNIALDEAMACGIPGIIYDLPKLDYPKGVLKTPVSNYDLYVSNVIKLLTDKILRKKLSEDALDFSKELDWNVRAQMALDFIS